MSDFEIDILIEDLRWNEAVDGIDALVARAIHACVAYLSAHSYAIRAFSEISLALVSDEKIQNLNAQFRDKDVPTNVLSFPIADAGGFNPLLGDIVLAYDTITREASDREMALSDHLTHLIVHGFLHLCGFDHKKPEDAKDMETIEIKTLEGLGMANPYVKD